MIDINYQAEDRVERLKNRTKRCVCKYCGGSLSLRRIVFSEHEAARVEIFCNHCQRIEYGVEPEIYHNAKYFVDVLGFNGYPDLDANEKTRRMNIAKVSEIMTWGDKNLGFLNQDGFTVPVQQNKKVIGECLILDREDVEATYTEGQEKWIQ